MNSNTSSGIGFLGILQIIFIVLKVCNLIDWSWVYVLIPLWVELISVAIFIIVFLILEYHVNKKW